MELHLPCSASDALPHTTWFPHKGSEPKNLFIGGAGVKLGGINVAPSGGESGRAAASQSLLPRAFILLLLVRCRGALVIHQDFEAWLWECKWKYGFFSCLLLPSVLPHATPVPAPRPELRLRLPLSPLPPPAEK